MLTTTAPLSLAHSAALVEEAFLAEERPTTADASLLFGGPSIAQLALSMSAASRCGHCEVDFDAAP